MIGCRRHLYRNKIKNKKLKNKFEILKINNRSSKFIMQPDIYTKRVAEKEFMFTLICSAENIGAKLVNWSKDDDKLRIGSQLPIPNSKEFTIHLKKYPDPLYNEPDWNIYKNDAAILISKLHNLGIFHGDISEQNFVVDPKTKEIKLIDYGRSCWITDADEKKISTYGVASSKEEMIKMEVKEVEWLFRKKM